MPPGQEVSGHRQCLRVRSLSRPLQASSRSSQTTVDAGSSGRRGPPRGTTLPSMVLVGNIHSGSYRSLLSWLGAFRWCPLGPGGCLAACPLMPTKRWARGSAPNLFAPRGCEKLRGNKRARERRTRSRTPWGRAQRGQVLCGGGSPLGKDTSCHSPGSAASRPIRRQRRHSPGPSVHVLHACDLRAAMSRGLILPSSMPGLHVRGDMLSEVFPQVGQREVDVASSG